MTMESSLIEENSKKNDDDDEDEDDDEALDMEEFDAKGCFTDDVSIVS